ncbi:putative myosin class II heavy chain (MHC), partial [Aspergillus ibericus CBS 121593]
PSSLRDDSLLTVPLTSFSATPGASSRSIAGSPGRSNSPRGRSVTPIPPNTLPTLSKYRAAWDSSTSPENRRAASSIYYTTAWGSPYAAPSPRRLSWSLSQHGGVDRGSGNSSPASMHSGIRHGSESNNPELLRPSARDSSVRQLYSGNSSRSPARDFFGRKGGKSIKDFTQDWINQYLSGQPRTERSNWLSDDSGSEAPSFITAQNYFAEDASDDWLGLEQDTRDDDLLKTPTLADFVNRRTAGSRREGSLPRQRARDFLHKRADTLRQEDFWGFAYDKDPQPITMDSHETQSPVEQGSNKALPTIEKPLPPTPGAPSPTERENPTEPKAMNSQALDRSSQTPVQRFRKKIVWRGKACFIALPLEDKRGTEESGRPLLTVEDVQERLKNWEEQGYDTRGFSVGESDDLLDTGLGGLSRPLFPDPAEVQEDRHAGRYGVSIPDKAEWDAYVAYLQEEKLRALGVFLDEPKPSISPASAAMSQMAPFPGLVSSPPIPTASAASNPLSLSHHFSPQLGQPANPAGLGTLASPASQFSIQTPFLGVDQNLLPGYPIQFQPTPPAQGSLTPQSFFNARQAGPAASIPGTLPHLGSILSPVSPLNEQGAFHPGLNEQPGPSKETFGDHDMRDNIAEGQLLRPYTPTEGPDHFHASTVEIAQPTPRGHDRGHNLSETLQKGLDRFPPSYHLEETIDRQLDEGDREPVLHNFDGSDLLQSRWAFPGNDNLGSQQFPQHMHQFYGGDYAADNAHEGSDIDTNPSLSGTPQRHGPLASNIPWHEPKPSAGSYTGGHRSKLSSSTLNVDAKEFNPTGSAPSQSFPFQEPPFQPPAVGNPMFTFGSVPSFNPSANAFNLTAPPFTPNAANNHTTRKAGSGEFKFSTASFNVAAPAFNPTGSAITAEPEQPAGARTKIFDDADVSEASKLSKKSKAIPIVRPDDPKEDKSSKEDGENDNGRPTRTDRHKRARRGDEASDGEAQFTMSHALAETGNAQPSQAPNAHHVPAEGKENVQPEGGESNETVQKPVTIQDDKFAERKETPISEASTWTPFDKKESTAAMQESSPADDKQAESEQLPAEREDVGIIEQEQSIEADAKPSFLSATARPFEFKASVPEYVPVVVGESTLAPNAADDRKSDVASNAPVSPKREPVLAEAAQTDEDSPDDEELNAIMEQLNDDSDVGIERLSTPQPRDRIPESVLHPSKEKRHIPADIRSEAPSPSPGRGFMAHALDVPKLDFEARSQFSVSPSKGVGSGIHSPVRHLVNQNDHISDWDDVISSGEDEKLANRSRFFDRRINDLVGSAIDERLTPLERALGVIQDSVMAIAPAPRTKLEWSASIAGDNSDADDEEDAYENASYSTRSVLRQKEKLDRMKAVFLEALASRDSEQNKDQTNSELAQLRDSVSALQALTVQKLSQDPVEELRVIIQDLASNQLSQQNSRPSEAEEIGAESLMLQIEGLKNMLRVSDERAEQEYKLRREALDSVAELQRLLKVAEEDAARHSEAAESAETRLLHFKAEKIPYFENIQHKADSLEQEQETLKFTLAELSSKNIALQGTLDEYRVSSDNWKRDSEQSRAELDTVRAENKELRGTISQLKTRLEDGMSIRHNLGEKLDRLQDEMATVTRDVIRDQASYRRREEELNAKYNELRAAFNRETKLREKLEYDINELEAQEREAAKLKFIFGQSQQENARLEELVAHLRLETHDLELKAARFEREFNEARESSRVEIQRTRNSLESDLEVANSQVNIVRSELETQILRLQSQMDNVRLESDTARERYEMLLEEANETKASTLAAAVQAKELAVEEQRRTHERVLNDLRERHARALHNASEDRQRTEAHLMDRLALSDDKVKHLEDRVHHLEERLEIAQSAARAAAEAAQSAKAAVPALVPAHSSSPSMPFREGSMMPEKISPQALRESILVLQDQLQQRESRIEELEQEVAAIDKDAPNKIKEKDTEITWLRELLGVRIDDLQDIITTVSQPAFDRNAVRDAAIRLKANLQMQQQERERVHSGHSFPSLPSLADLTASPRSFPLAAAAAWGNWRKGRDNSHSHLSEQTPSKPTNASSFLSGLLTPPASSVRQASPHAGPSATAGSRRPSESRPLRNYNTTPKAVPARASRMREPPSTPPLLRRSSYDHDAEPADYAHDSFGEDAESTADGLVSASPRDAADGPFGPQIQA